MPYSNLRTFFLGDALQKQDKISSSKSFVATGSTNKSNPRKRIHLNSYSSPDPCYRHPQENHTNAECTRKTCPKCRRTNVDFARINEWTPYGFLRKRGNPRTRWRKEIYNRAGILWSRCAQNKNTWKKIEEAYAPEWTG